MDLSVHSILPPCDSRDRYLCFFQKHRNNISISSSEVHDLWFFPSLSNLISHFFFLYSGQPTRSLLFTVVCMFTLYILQTGTSTLSHTITCFCFSLAQVMQHQSALPDDEEEEDSDDEEEETPDPCLQNLCAQGSTCAATRSGEYTCKCPPGYSGKYCETAPSCNKVQTREYYQDVSVTTWTTSTEQVTCKISLVQYMSCIHHHHFLHLSYYTI